ncbi:MAG TPA: hypothetical protein IAA26_07325 [Candidatus Blautia faecipullorum]|nr:hypothetical protein [Candidatus Blautia faecipullorum]
MKQGFLFGAGAEIDYDMPSGGTFALDIFCQDETSAKEEFKAMRDAIDPRQDMRLNGCRRIIAQKTSTVTAKQSLRASLKTQ